MSKSINELLRVAKAYGLAITGLPKARTKFPKTKLGALADEYHDIREIRLVLQKITDAVKQQETAIVDHLIDCVSADDTSSGVIGKRYKAVVKRKTVPIVEDWDVFYTHLQKTQEFDLLNRALNRSAVTARLEDGITVPGTTTFEDKVLSVTKV